jgi:hypothetical protein
MELPKKVERAKWYVFGTQPVYRELRANLGMKSWSFFRTHSMYQLNLPHVWVDITIYVAE